MKSEEDEMSLARWRRLLGTELTIALEELPKIAKDGAKKRHQRYVWNCAEQRRTIIARNHRNDGEKDGKLGSVGF